MNNIANQHAAPIPESAWQEMEDVARHVLSTNLSGRRFCTINGPLGIDVAAINTGRVEQTGQSEQLVWGTRTSKPLIETRSPFTLSLSKVLYIAHGARDIDWTELEQAAYWIAEFEEQTIYYGNVAAKITGLIEGAAHPARSCSEGPEGLLEGIAEARSDLEQAGMGNQLVLVVGDQAQRWLNRTHQSSGQRLAQVVGHLLDGGQIIRSPVVQHAALVACGPDHFELSLGQDLCLRYGDLNGDDLSMSFLGTFTFQLLEDRAVVPLIW